jgi:MSHA biogenesis protein MshO
MLRMHIPEMPTTTTTLQRGFTLAEAVVVIAITGIVMAAVAIFIRLPVQGYIDSVARADVTDAADTALRRMARDIRLAVPNSVRITTAGGVTYLEFLLTKTGGRYLAEEDNPTDTAPILTFTAINPVTDSIFTVVGGVPTGAQAIAPGDKIVVYNLGPGQTPADAYQPSPNTNIAAVTAVNAANSTITLATNPFTTQNPKMPSPGRRFDVVQTPVTYACAPNAAGGTITRFSGYAIGPAQPNNMAAAPLAAAQSALLAAGVIGCVFSYDNSPGNQRSGLVGLGLSLQTPNSASGTVVLFHQVHVSNTP